MLGHFRVFHPCLCGQSRSNCRENKAPNGQQHAAHEGRIHVAQRGCQEIGNTTEEPDRPAKASLTLHPTKGLKPFAQVWVLRWLGIGEAQ